MDQPLLVLLLPRRLQRFDFEQPAELLATAPLRMAELGLSAPPSGPAA